jgi:TolA-binding protein
MVVVFLLGGLLSARAAPRDSMEIAITEADFKQLETSEAAALAKADKLFTQRKYREAVVEYDAFMMEHKQSSAAGYALLRKGRSQMLDNKRNEAVMTFKEVIDYFPNADEYAAASLFYQGQAFFENGEPKNAVKVWKKMVADPGYKQHRLAAPALMSLADYLVKDGKAVEAGPFYEQVSLDFRARNRETAKLATERAYRCYVRLIPDEKKFRTFYTRVSGAEGKSSEFEKIQDVYWKDLRDMIKGYDTFEGEKAKDERAAYYKYWADQMEGKRLKDTAFRIDWAWFRLQHEGKVPAWIERLDNQFASTHKAGDNLLIVDFIAAFAMMEETRKEKIEEYYIKLKFPEMNNAQIVQLIRALLAGKREDMARSACDRIDHSKWTDKDRMDFLDTVASLDELLTKAVCKKMTDRDLGNVRLLKYYAGDEYGTKPDKLDKAIPVSEEVVKLPQYASGAYMTRGKLFMGARRFEEAIESFINSQKEPESLFAVVTCYVAMRKRDEALTQLTQIENYFKEYASRAALETANVHLEFGDKKSEIAALLNVMKKYKASGESSKAHMRLEKYGIGMKGGEHEAD